MSPKERTEKLFPFTDYPVMRKSKAQCEENRIDAILEDALLNLYPNIIAIMEAKYPF